MPSSHPLAAQLRSLGLYGMAQGLDRIEATLAGEAASFAAPLSRLVEDELAERKRRRIAGRLRAAQLRYQAPMADVDYNAPRGFDDGLFHWLAIGEWIADKGNVIIDGPPGVGKTWLACALGEAVCRNDRSVLYQRVPELLSELADWRGGERYTRRMQKLRSVELLILDDWAIEPLVASQRQDLLKIIEHRYGRGSTLIASPVPVENWAEVIGAPVVAAALLDRIIHNASRLQLRGESLRAAAP